MYVFSHLHGAGVFQPRLLLSEAQYKAANVNRDHLKYLNFTFYIEYKLQDRMLIAFGE